MSKVKTPSLIGIVVFIICLGVLFIENYNDMNKMILLVSGFYGLLCLGFLIFQLYAFIKAHTDYDEEIEDIKYQVFEAEEMLRPQGE